MLDLEFNKKEIMKLLNHNCYNCHWHESDNNIDFCVQIKNKMTYDCVTGTKSLEKNELRRFCSKTVGTSNCHWKKKKF